MQRAERASESLAATNTYVLPHITYITTDRNRTCVHGSSDFRHIAWYWLGASANSLFVLTLAIACSNSGPNWCCILYLPYMVGLSIIVFYLCSRSNCSPHGNSLQKLADLNTTTTTTTSADSSRSIDLQKDAKKRIWPNSSDILRCAFDVTYFLLCIAISVLRAIVCIRGASSRNEFADGGTDYLSAYQQIEPGLLVDDPAPFARVQMLVYLFYFVPFYISAIYRAVVGGERGGWFAYATLFYAGAAANASVCHIGCHVHYRTPYVLRVSSREPRAQVVFWTVNIALGLVPQLFAATYLPAASSAGGSGGNDPRSDTVRHVASGRDLRESQRIKHE